MKNYLIPMLSLLALLGCDQGATSGSAETQSTGISTNDEITTVIAEPDNSPCVPDAKILEGNKEWLRSSNLIISILADSTTYDEELGDSHRVLSLFDTRSCKEISRELLPVNISPDYAYQLADISFHRSYQMIAIKGMEEIYCYDVAERQLSQPFRPRYLTEKFREDAQSGTIQWLEVWEDYMLGYASDFGPFAFKISEERRIEPLLPLVEYGTVEGYTGLFICGVGKGLSQVLLPIYDRDERELELRTVFDQPRAVNLTKSKVNLADGYFLLGEDQSSGAPLIVDLQKARLLELPKNLNTKDERAVNEWLNKNT